MINTYEPHCEMCRKNPYQHDHQTMWCLACAWRDEEDKKRWPAIVQTLLYGPFRDTDP